VDAEARTVAEAIAAVEAGAAVVMLDNFSPDTGLREAVAAVRAAIAASHRAVEIEASGGVTLDNLAAFAACGVDRVSVGALTHSVRSLDLSMTVEVAA
jgi:nicotinate-nucleotide pyrophosphorylase (carboxylating)